MQGNGIGPLVSQLVHERNAQRAAARGKGGEAAGGIETSIKPHPQADTVEFSESALARFEALKVKWIAEAPAEDPGTVADVEPTRNGPAETIDPVDGTETSLRQSLSATEGLRTPRLSIYA